MSERAGSVGPDISLSEARSAAIQIRRYRPDDAPAIVNLYNSQEAESGPHSVEEFQRELAERESVANGGLWVAVDQEEAVAGYAAWDRAWWTGRQDVYAVEIRVDRGKWGRGLGSRLLESLLSQPFSDHAARFLTWMRVDLAEARRFAARHDFEPTGQVVEECRLYLPDARDEHASELAARLEAEGIRIVSMAELPVDEAFLHQLHLLWATDEADDGPQFETWRSSVLDDPGLSPEMHWVALHGELPVGTTFLKRLGLDSAENDYTAVAPAYRGRGIAYALKRRAIGWGRAHNMQWFYTSSLLENAPMLAINRRLGYLPGVRKQEMARDLEHTGCR